MSAKKDMTGFRSGCLVVLCEDARQFASAADVQKLLQTSRPIYA